MYKIVFKKELLHNYINNLTPEYPDELQDYPGFNRIMAELIIRNNYTLEIEDKYFYNCVASGVDLIIVHDNWEWSARWFKLPSNYKKRITYKIKFRKELINDGGSWDELLDNYPGFNRDMLKVIINNNFIFKIYDLDFYKAIGSNNELVRSFKFPHSDRSWSWSSEWFELPHNYKKRVVTYE